LFILKEIFMIKTEKCLFKIIFLDKSEIEKAVSWIVFHLINSMNSTKLEKQNFYRFLSYQYLGWQKIIQLKICDTENKKNLNQSFSQYCQNYH
jgi:hypothetical protein